MDKVHLQLDPSGCGQDPVFIAAGLQMQVCVCVCVRVFVYACVFIRNTQHTCMRMYSYMKHMKHIHTRMHMYSYIIYTHMCMHMYLYIIHTHTNMHMYSYVIHMIHMLHQKLPESEILTPCTTFLGCVCGFVSFL